MSPTTSHNVLVQPALKSDRSPSVNSTLRAVTNKKSYWDVMLNPWLTISVILVIVLSYVYVDRSLALFLHQLHLKKELPILYWITCLGVTQAYLILLPLAAACSFLFVHNKKAEHRLWFLWSCVLFTSLINIILKMTLGRARPELFFDQQLFGFYGWHVQESFYSFPSGHTTAITSLMLGLMISFPRYRYAFAIMGLLVISTRVLLTYHYLSDILATMYLTCIELGLLFYMIRRWHPKTWGLVLK
ncbi:MAG: phosphatase PAP2 family protein [Legionellaceae bacterium]|nr:phosphatase PAP2 family protein [Legionellaceae bacterium]